MKYAAMEYQLTWKNESTGEVHFAYVNCEDDKNALCDILQDNDGIITLEPMPMVSLKQEEDEYLIFRGTKNERHKNLTISREKCTREQVARTVQLLNESLPIDSPFYFDYMDQI